LIVIVVILELLLESAIGAQEMACLLGALLILSKTVGIGMVMVGWDLMTVKVAKGRMTEGRKLVLLVVILERRFHMSLEISPRVARLRIVELLIRTTALEWRW
jgi:hypothetical protein